MNPPVRWNLRGALGLALLVFTGACASAPALRAPALENAPISRADESAARALYEEGLAAVDAGDYEIAARRFGEVVEEYSASDWSGLALYWRGRALYQARDDEGAARDLARYLDLAPDLPFREHAVLLLANALFGLARYDDALAAALRVDAASAERRGDFLALARDLMNRLPRPVIESAVDDRPARAWLAPLYIQAARWALADGDPARATELARAVLEFDDLPAETLADARALAGGDPGRAAAGPRLGFLAPTEGRFAQVSEQVRRGVALALDDVNAMRATPIELVGRASSQDPDSTAEVIRALARSDRVMAILGPLVSETALAAAGAAESEGVPLVSPTATDARLLDLGPRVFSINTLDGSIGFTIGNYAARTLERDRFAILAQDSPYGRIQADAFTRAVQSAGGRIVLRRDHDRGATDFTDLLGEIVRAGAEAVFLATNSANEALRIQNQIAFYELALLPLGTDAWNDEEFTTQGRGFVRGYFADTFSRDPSVTRWRTFAESYEARYGEPPPNRIPAWGYDAARLAIEHIGAGAPASRVQDPYRGASALFRFTPEGPRRAVVVHQIQAGEPVALEW